MSFVFSNDFLSPISPISPLSPISQIKVTPYATQITTTNVFTPAYPYVAYVNVDTGLNSSYIVQKDITEYLWYRVLDKWFYSSELCHLLKYLKISSNGEVQFVSNDAEAKDNKVCNDNVENIEKKTDFIQENLLTMKDMKKLLQRVIEELDYKWYELTSKEKLIVEVVERHLRKVMEQRIGSK